jgi:hypothetical protein
MPRHHIDFQADLADVVAALADSDFVGTTADGSTGTVELRDNMGTLHEIDGRCQIEFGDDAEEVEVARLVETLRAAGYSVEHLTEERH